MSFQSETTSESRKQSNLYLVRHGQTDWNRAQRLQGHIDIPLNTHGTLQAHRLAQHLSEYPINTILTSPLRRARSTGRIIAAYSQCSLEVDEDLIEIHHGSWQGLTLPAIQSRFIDDWVRWRTRPSTAHVPQAESPEQVMIRITRVLSRLEDPHVCVVSHGVVLQILLTHLLGQPLDCFPRFSLPNACLFHFQSGGNFDFYDFPGSIPNDSVGSRHEAPPPSSERSEASTGLTRRATEHNAVRPSDGGDAGEK